jgi:hypothetical protein
MISQKVRNESVLFVKHIDIEVSYKILRLVITKLVSILYYLACFQKGLFGGYFEQKYPHAFKGQQLVEEVKRIWELLLLWSLYKEL